MNTIQKIVHLSSKIQPQVLRPIRVLVSSPAKYMVASVQIVNAAQCRRSMSSYQETHVVKEGYIKKLLNSIPFLGINQSKLRIIALLHFEMMVGEIDYNKFFEELDLPDTFYSWFIVTELHLWMLSTRAMAEGKEGRILRNDMVGALWTDVSQRVKKLGVSAYNSEVRTKIVELSEQLQATFIAYDEGIQAEDVVLAGALWRRFYQQEDVDLEQLEILISYIRRNMRILDKLTKEEFYDSKNIKWIPL